VTEHGKFGFFECQTDFFRNNCGSDSHSNIGKHFLFSVAISGRFNSQNIETTATSGDVVWQLAIICVADAETDDPAFNTASTVTDTAKGTTNQTNDAAITTVTVTGCAAGELMHIKILRDSAHASDTLAATARLIGVELVIREAM
jgi:hypothetical protein